MIYSRMLIVYVTWKSIRNIVSFTRMENRQLANADVLIPLSLELNILLLKVCSLNLTSSVICFEAICIDDTVSFSFILLPCPREVNSVIYSYSFHLFVVFLSFPCFWNHSFSIFSIAVALQRLKNQDCPIINPYQGQK